MAEVDGSLEEAIRNGMRHWEHHAQDQIADWAIRQHDIVTREQALFQRADTGILSFDRALFALREHNDDRDWDVAWDAYTQTPAYQEELRRDAMVDAAIDRVTSPEYLGEQAEQRFYEEYGEDAGDDDTEADTWEPTMAPRGSGEYDLQASMPMHAEARFDSTVSLSSDPLEIDTDSADMGMSWREQLAALEARLDALTEQQLTLDLDHGQDELQMELRHEQGGMSY